MISDGTNGANMTDEEVKYEIERVKAERDKEIIDALVNLAEELDKKAIPGGVRYVQLAPGHPLTEVFVP